MNTEPTAEKADSGTPRLQCAFALQRGRYCRLPYGHDGDHAPNRQIDQTTEENQ